jgi:hypothetical protein
MTLRASGSGCGAATGIFTGEARFGAGARGLAAATFAGAAIFVGAATFGAAAFAAGAGAGARRGVSSRSHMSMATTPIAPSSIAFIFSFFFLWAARYTDARHLSMRPAKNFV